MSATSYPEHLNPFNEPEKKKSGLRGSFRDLKRTIRMSFRKKKKEPESQVEIRQHPVYPTFNRQHQTASHPAFVTTPALPRSRFQERLNKAQTLAPSNGTLSRTSDMEGHNPFEECDEEEEGSKTILRRRKKRAPLPPKFRSSQNINGSQAVDKSSNWSLTSVESNYSNTTDNTLDNENISVINDELKRFTKDMEKLNVDRDSASIPDEEKSNQENFDIEEKRQSATIPPDVVVSCANDIDRVPQENVAVDTIANSNASLCSETETKDLSNNNKNEANIDEVNNNSNIIETDNVTSPKIEEEDGEDIITVLDITANLQNGDTDTSIKEEENNNNNCTQNPENDLNFNERKSIYIAGSTDELNDDSHYRKSTFIYIASSKENLDNVTNSSQESVVQSDNSGDTPIPKQRKKKLSKSALLGQ